MLREVFEVTLMDAATFAYPYRRFWKDSLEFGLGTPSFFEALTPPLGDKVVMEWPTLVSRKGGFPMARISVKMASAFLCMCIYIYICF